MEKLRVAGLFAGIGGIEKGLEETGRFETALFSEVDPQASAVIEDRFPGVPNVGDISKLKRLPDGIDLITAGFPCQDLSQAGRTNGISGSRSGLVDHVFRLVEARTDVEWLLIENVPFMLRLYRGEAMSHLVTRLEGTGFRWAYRILDTRAFGLPQRRRRVFVLAARNQEPGRVLFFENAEPPVEDEDAASAFGFYSTEGNRGLGWAINAVPPLKGGSGLGIPSPPAVFLRDEDRIVTPDVEAAERLQGFPAGWTAPAGRVGRESGRWRLIGNAVSVPVARWIGKSLVKNAGSFERSRPTRPLRRDSPWPSAALGGPALARSAVAVSEWPCVTPRMPLSDTLGQRCMPLSSRAAEGFLQRYVNGGLRTRGFFVDALRRHIDRVSEGRTAALIGD